MQLLKVLVFVGMILVAYKSGEWTVVRRLEQTTEPNKEMIGTGSKDKLDVMQLPVSRELWGEILADARISEGRDQAKVTIVAYLDRQECEECELFVREVLPRIRTEYIDSGEVRYIELPFADSGHPKAAGITKSPSFFVGKAKLAGAQPYISFASLIDKELESAK